jgi:signal transduction histidine kinase
MRRRHLEHRLDIRRRDELGELAASINAMADDIRDMLEAKRQLPLAISHELRSPLTPARVNAELLAASVPRKALLTDLGELETLLGELLDLERLCGRQAALVREAIDPSELLTALVRDSFGDADVRLDPDPPGTWLPLDRMRIRLLARNLLTIERKAAVPHAKTPARRCPDRRMWQDASMDQLGTIDRSKGDATAALAKQWEGGSNNF